MRNTLTLDEEKTKICLITDIAKYIKLHQLTPIEPDHFDLLMDSSIQEIEEAFQEIRTAVEGEAHSPQHPR